MPESPTRDQFLGGLLGLAVGDALGAPYEGLPSDVIFRMGPADALVADPPDETLYYTDDTQMALGVAEVLVAYGEIRPEALGVAFAANYQPERGYGAGARRILEAIRDGGDARALAEGLFPGGSLGNGAAMRVAPVGLLFRDDLDRAAEQARLSALPTHVHPLGIDGARLLALAVALATRGGPFDRRAFLRELAARAETEEFRWQLETAARLRACDPVGTFGNSLEAHRSVVTAIALFAVCPDDYARAVARAIGQGNDTDTLAAMAGALVGARRGLGAIPAPLVAKLEDGSKGRAYILELADRLHAAYLRRT
jgi:poly(ADP-ribose) glycohydrolase ARH3